MRLWSIHPKYLDSKGLVALWRETLLAKNVLEDKTKGYKNHPQLIRFKNMEYPIIEINNYLKSIWDESLNRGYNFNKSKFDFYPNQYQILVTSGQIDYEFKLLQRKLFIRDNKKYDLNLKDEHISINENFILIPGGIESWERV